MSLKSIEMQIALPRTFEAGKTSQQHQQQGQMMQEFAGALMEKEMHRRRKTVTESEKTDQAKLKENEGQGTFSQQENDQQSKQEGKQKEQLKQYHPYKGKQIDFSG